MRFALPLLFAAATAAGAQPSPKPTPHPTKVVATSGRLVTARTSDGSTRSFNCRKPENKRRSVCRGHH